jgi:hypothetical protein
MNEDQRPVVGKNIEIKFPQLGGLVLEAKIDSGAGQSSLHADDIKASGESVSFVLEGKRITMNQAGKAEVRTADNGGDSRPVIKLDIETEHGSFKGVEFNLNDRSDMPDKVLLGHNFLELGKFVIDPLKEEQESEPVAEEPTRMFVVKKADGTLLSTIYEQDEMGDNIIEVSVINIRSVE